MSFNGKILKTEFTIKLIFFMVVFYSYRHYYPNNFRVSDMIIRNKGYCLLTIAICMAVLSAPGIGAEAGLGREDFAALVAGAIVLHQTTIE